MQKRETAAPSSPQLGGLVRAVGRKESRRPTAAAVRCVDAAQRKERIYNLNGTNAVTRMVKLQVAAALAMAPSRYSPSHCVALHAAACAKAFK